MGLHKKITMLEVLWQRLERVKSYECWSLENIVSSVPVQNHTFSQQFTTAAIWQTYLLCISLCLRRILNSDQSLCHLTEKISVTCFKICESHMTKLAVRSMKLCPVKCLAANVLMILGAYDVCGVGLSLLVDHFMTFNRSQSVIPVYDVHTRTCWHREKGWLNLPDFTYRLILNTILTNTADDCSADIM